MTTTSTETKRALSSKDGTKWQQSGSVRESAWPVKPDTSVVKLVLGRLGDAKDGDDWDEILPMLQSGLKTHFPALTHLHLWGLPMEKLGPLPEGLEALDVRKCSQLSQLPELPVTLEILDLAECLALNNLPKQGIASLRWFHVDGCMGIPSNRMLSFLEDCRDLEEFTAKGCSHLVELTLPPQDSTPPDGTWHPQFPIRRLKKLVLEGCSSLTKLPDLSVYPWLHHLNLNKCSALESIQSLPAWWTEEGDYEVGIRYLLTEGCERLQTFCDLDVRKIHLSVTGEDNVARVWRTMKRLSDDSGEMVMSKLLLLGSGRCGKTTISKAIQGEVVCIDEKSTRNIQFSQWQTNFQFHNGDVKPGTVHIWDFGGQEIYHNTHRLFASEGSVFIIATTDTGTHESRLKKELASISDKREKAFRERENEYRELKYWLDYLRSALRLESIDDFKSSRGKISVLVVHTGAGSENEARDYLRKQAGPYAALLDHDIRIVAVDFHGKNKKEPTRLILSWLGDSLGVAADRYGMRVPALFSKMAQIVAKELREPRLDRMFLSFEEWTSLVTVQTPELQTLNDLTRKKIEIEQADAVATHLHRCGIVFRLKKSKGGYEIMLNQKWGIDRIYALTAHDVAPDMADFTHRPFEEDRLREIINNQFCDRVGWSMERCDLVLDLLDQCSVCARTVGKEWIAIQKELLPQDGEKIMTDMARIWEHTLTKFPDLVNHSFALHGDQESMLGDSDFRSVLAFVAREQRGKLLDCMLPEPKEDVRERQLNSPGRSRGADFRLWGNGFQVSLDAEIEGRMSASIVRVEWKPCGEGNFEGGLFVQILCSDDDGSGKRFRNLLFGDDGPLSIFKGRYAVSDRRVFDLSREELPKLRGVGQPGWLRKDGPIHAAIRHDVALSYRSPQKDLAKDAVIDLKRAQPDILIYHYQDDARCRLSGKEEESRISEIYRYLKSSRVLIAIASKDYFEEPDLEKGKNLYCPVELADAIASFPSERDGNSFFWVFADDVSNKNFEPMLAGGTEEHPKGILEVYFEKVIKPRRPIGFKDHRSSLRKYEECAVLLAADKLESFVEELGPDSKQSVDSSRKGWVGLLTTAILKSIRKK